MKERFTFCFDALWFFGAHPEPLHFYSAVKLAIKPRIVHNCLGQLSTTELSNGGVVKCAAQGWGLELNA